MSIGAVTNSSMHKITLDLYLYRRTYKQIVGINNNVSVMFDKYIWIVGIKSNIPVTFDNFTKLRQKVQNEK